MGEYFKMTSEEELLKVINQSAVDLISTNGSNLSLSAIKTRMIGIADDLKYAVESNNLGVK